MGMLVQLNAAGGGHRDLRNAGLDGDRRARRFCAHCEHRLRRQLSLAADVDAADAIALCFHGFAHKIGALAEGAVAETPVRCAEQHRRRNGRRTGDRHAIDVAQNAEAEALADRLRADGAKAWAIAADLSDLAATDAERPQLIDHGAS